MGYDSAAAAGTVRMFLTGVCVLAAAQIARVFYEGIQTRRKFQQMKAQGIPLLEHSWVFGHLKVLGRLRRLFPADANRTYSQIYIVQHWREFFPNATECPPVLYFDLWPLTEPIALVLDPAMCQELVQERNQPRHIQNKYLIKDIAGTRNLTWWDGAEHRRWRSRLNPGFSTRNLQSHMSAFVDEVNIFVDNLKKTAGKDGAWGSVFPLLPRVIDLTFDIIGRVVLDLHLNEQNNGPTELQSTMRTLVSQFAFKSLLTTLRRMSPSYQLRQWRCQRALRRALMPRIMEQIGTEQPATQKTVIQLAMNAYEGESQASKRSVVGSEFVEDVLGLTQQFLFAGHDTTATTITWCFHYLAKHPEAMKRMRAEHDEVFGKETKDVPDTVRSSPQMLNSLPFTLAVVKEVLRLCPVAATLRRGEPSFFFTGRDGTRYPTDGFALVTAVGAMHQHPDLWPRASEFLPERWTVPEEDPLHPSRPGQWRPFEFGPMNCIGQELAMIELRMVLLFTVRELDIESAWSEWDAMPGNEGQPKNTIDGERAYRSSKGIAPPTNGLPVHVRLRRVDA